MQSFRFTSVLNRFGIYTIYSILINELMNWIHWTYLFLAKSKTKMFPWWSPAAKASPIVLKAVRRNLIFLPCNENALDVEWLMQTISLRRNKWINVSICQAATAGRPFWNTPWPPEHFQFNLQYVVLFPGHPYFWTLRLYDSAFCCKKETNSNDTIQRLID